MNARVILITGGNGALGQAISHSFLDETAENIIFLGARGNRAAAEARVSEAEGRVHLLSLDVTQPEAWKLAVQDIISRHGRLDVLVNNAGKHSDHLLASMPLPAWEEVLSANLSGVFHGCQAVLPQMISQRQGRIINIASLSALFAPPGQTNYAASKAGVVALTQSLAKEIARLNITVNAVCPGYIETPALESLSAEERKAAQARVPMRRFGRPEEVAEAVRFLACPGASYITGSILKIDGGIF
ncbi:MAG TPA: SDR family NAD(P)-dependent oxidoreductase [Verrucomicrobiae bacterium]|nr:SDR family NAD(P)-dependent oxidoreductase [Verrucomicrobiae bacterium]